MTDFLTRRRQTFLSQSLYATTRLFQLTDIVSSGSRLVDSKDSLFSLAADAEVNFAYRFDLWKLDYTAGVPIEELAPQLSNVVDAFEKWEQINVEFRNQLHREDPSVEVKHSACELGRFDHYQEMIQLVGAAVLLRDARSVKRIVRALKYSRQVDELFETLVQGYVDDPHADIDGVEHIKPWRVLMDAYYQDDDPVRIVACVNRFCKAWYPAMKGLPWHDAHRRIRTADGQERGRYYGYWAFEAGAVAYLLDIDDTAIDHMVYPRDLVAYGKALRASDAWTTPNVPLQTHILVKTGEHAPHSGVYAAHDGLAREIDLKQGDILPEAEDLMDPKRPKRAFTWILRQRRDGGPVTL